MCGPNLETRNTSPLLAAVRMEKREKATQRFGRKFELDVPVYDIACYSQLCLRQEALLQAFPCWWWNDREAGQGAHSELVLSFSADVGADNQLDTQNLLMSLLLELFRNVDTESWAVSTYCKRP